MLGTLVMEEFPAAGVVTQSLLKEKCSGCFYKPGSMRCSACGVLYYCSKVKSFLFIYLFIYFFFAVIKKLFDILS